MSGHRTGTNKANRRRASRDWPVAFRARASWVIPSGDALSLRMARVFQAELGAYGYQDGRYAGVGEHDDTVIAAWLVERAIAWVEELRQFELPELVFAEDLGIEPVRTGLDF